MRRVDVRDRRGDQPAAGRAKSTAGAFRADLWYRLDVIRIALPPLRERLEDLPLLVAPSVAARSPRARAAAPRSSPPTVAALAAYDWPGNIRELQNVLASMLVAAPRAGLIGPSALPAHIARAAAFERDAHAGRRAPAVRGALRARGARARRRAHRRRGARARGRRGKGSRS